MQTRFAPQQLADPKTAESERILRTCVHCGFCTATCPTYLLLGDELDSPRGRIYLIKDMLEGGKAATPEVVKHVDRCLSCLACMTTCPSGVHYMHLVDHARAHIEHTFRRPLPDRLLRALYAMVLAPSGPASAWPCWQPGPAGRCDRCWRGCRAGSGRSSRRASIWRRRARRRRPNTRRDGRSGPASRGDRRGRVALLSGCAQQVLRPAINDATIRLLGRHGVEVVLPKGEGCCGALVHHMGREAEALDFARTNVDVWTREIEAGGLDAIVITASGCGTTIKDYGFMLRDDPAYAQKAARVSGLAKDITEVLATLQLDPPRRTLAAPIAYHSACSMQHGQKITDTPKLLLKAAGFTVRDVPEGHICCGSAGTYNLLLPEIAGRLRARKVANIEAIKPAVIATGNIGCMTQIGLCTAIPIVHTVELLDWAGGGPEPQGWTVPADLVVAPALKADARSPLEMALGS